MTERPAVERHSPEELAAAGAPILYPADEAALILDPSGRTTAYWLLKRARSGEFPCTQVGRSKVFSPANLAEIARLLNKPGRPGNTAAVPRSQGAGAKPRGKTAESKAATRGKRAAA